MCVCVRVYVYSDEVCHGVHSKLDWVIYIYILCLLLSS